MYFIYFTFSLYKTFDISGFILTFNTIKQYKHYNKIIFHSTIKTQPQPASKPWKPPTQPQPHHCNQYPSKTSEKEQKKRDEKPKKKSRAKGKNQTHAKGVSHMPDTWLEESLCNGKKKKEKGKKHYFTGKF